MRKACISKFLLLACFFLSATVVTGQQFSVLYFNTWSGLRGDGIFVSEALEQSGARDFREELLLDGLKRLAPTFAGLSDLNPLPSMVGKIEEVTGMGGIFFGERGGWRIGPVGLPVNLYSGTAIIGADPEAISRAGAARLSGGFAGDLAFAGNSNKIMIARAQIGNRELYLAVSNWTQGLWADESNLRSLVAAYSRGEISNNELLAAIKDATAARDARIREAQGAIDYINKIVGQAPVILMGTFGCAPGSDEYRLLLNAGFKDAWTAGSGETWDEIRNTNAQAVGQDLYRLGPSRDRVDYIMYRGPGLRLISSRMAFNEPTYSTWPSSRFGIMSRFELRP